jgi:hypothetical protein
VIDADGVLRTWAPMASSCVGRCGTFPQHVSRPSPCYGTRVHAYSSRANKTSQLYQG